MGAADVDLSTRPSVGEARRKVGAHGSHLRWTRWCMKRTLAALALAALTASTPAQPAQSPYVPDADPLVRQKIEQWQDLKLGLLMHWGTYSQWGIVESWSLCAEDESWCKRSMDDYTAYKAAYEALQTTFNPVRFDPDRWAKAAKDAGMRYVVFTTKHHDGFSMFCLLYTSDAADERS